LRDHLFATLEALRDEDDPMDLERAKTISEVSQTIINSAKVEVEAMKITGGTGTGFIRLNDNDKPELPGPRALGDRRRASR